MTSYNSEHQEVIAQIKENDIRQLGLELKLASTYLEMVVQKMELLFKLDLNK